MSVECGICHRISSKELYDYVRDVCEEAEILDDNRKIIFNKCIKLLHIEDKKGAKSIWCGRQRNVIIGGLIYAVSSRFAISDLKLERDYHDNIVIKDAKITQRDIAYIIGCTETSIREMYIKILKEIPEVNEV